MQSAEVKRKSVGTVVKKRTLLPERGCKSRGKRINLKGGEFGNSVAGENTCQNNHTAEVFPSGLRFNYLHPPGESPQFSDQPPLVRFLN